MNKTILRGIILRLIGGWLLCSAFALLVGAYFLDLLLPYFSWVVDLIQSDYRSTLSLSKSGDSLIEMTAVTRHSLRGIAAPGSKLTAGAHSHHVLIPFVLGVTILFAWPVIRLRQRIVLLLFGIPLILVIAALTVPFQLAGSIEVMLQGLAQKYSVARPSSLLLTWMFFLEVGGRWLLPIVLAVAICLSLQNVLFVYPSSLKRGKRNPRAKTR